MIISAYILWYFQIHQAQYPGKQIYKDYTNGFLYPLASSWIEPTEDTRRRTEVKESEIDWMTVPERYPHLNPQNLWIYYLIWKEGICMGRILRLGNVSVLPQGKGKCWSPSHVWLFATPWTVAARILCPWNSSGKNTSGVPFPSPGHLPDPGIEPGSPALQEDFLPSEPPGKPGGLSVITRFFIRKRQEG